MLRHLFTFAAACAASSSCFAQEAPATSPHVAVPAVPVMLSPELGEHRSGRLLVFAQRVEPGAEPQDSVDTSPFNPSGTAIAAREVSDLTPGTQAFVGASTDAFPTSFADLEPGTYRFQAVLDRDYALLQGAIAVLAALVLSLNWVFDALTDILAYRG